MIACHIAAAEVTLMISVADGRELRRARLGGKREATVDGHVQGPARRVPEPHRCQPDDDHRQQRRNASQVRDSVRTR